MSRPAHSETDVGGLPSATIEKAKRTGWLWLVPIGALALCGWFVYRDFVATGPTITIYFRNVEGVEAGNTDMKYLGAQVGRVRSVTLAKDRQHVRVRAQLIGSAADLARAGSQFWIVRPEVRVGAISGLRTIISGEFISVAPGNGARTNVFYGVEKEPIPEQPHELQLVLLSSHLNSLRAQSPIFYRGVQVGEVLRFQLGEDGQDVMLRARIRAEYAPMVRRNSVFWNAGGIDLSFGLFRGIEVNAESASTLLTGGIEFATPLDYGEPASRGTAFRLYDKPKEEWKNWAPAIRLHLPEQAPQPQMPFPGGAR